MGVGTAVGGNVILFVLIACMSATVEFSAFQKQAKNRWAIGTGVLLQFAVLPFLGFVVVKALNMPEIMGISLMIVTSSPGGSYSNFFCSLFNADLALSVTMTAISTILAVAMLPFNVFVYAHAAYGSDIVSSLNWEGLGISLAVVISAIVCGLTLSWRIGTKGFRLLVNRIGNVAGITLIIFSAVAPEEGNVPLTGRSWQFYVGVAMPIVLGLVLSSLISTWVKLQKPERVAISVECSYQNTSIAISVALTIYNGSDQAEALGVPFYYTGMQSIILTIYCLAAWKLGWSKAPKDKNIFTVILNSYEVESDEMEESANGVANEVAAAPHESPANSLPPPQTEHNSCQAECATNEEAQCNSPVGFENEISTTYSNDNSETRQSVPSDYGSIFANSTKT